MGRRLLTYLALAALCLMPSLAQAQYTVSDAADDIGVDLGQQLIDYATLFGAVLLAVIPIVLAMRLLRRGVKWVGGGGSGV